MNGKIKDQNRLVFKENQKDGMILYSMYLTIPL